MTESKIPSAIHALIKPQTTLFGKSKNLTGIVAYGIRVNLPEQRQAALIAPKQQSERA
jgi:hypothetical protein